jgi:hypothetical protein
MARRPFVKVIASPATLLGAVGAAAIGFVLVAAGFLVRWHLPGHIGPSPPPRRSKG